jgi:hypothetical protein
MVLGTFGFGLGVLGCRGKADDVGRVTGPEIGGTPSDCYPQAVRVMFPGQGLANACSGVVIASDLVLTAGHCAAGDGAFTPPSAVLTSGGTQWPVTQVYVHPNWNGCLGETIPNSARDMAVVRVGGNMGILPAARATSAPAVGTTLQLIGFGAPANDRRMGNFRVDDVSGGQITLHGKGAGDCPGDSGGPYFVPGACSGNPPPVVAGIVSAGATECVLNPQTFSPNLAQQRNAGWLDSVKQGVATPFDPAVLIDCCQAGQVQSCTTVSCSPGTQDCDPTTLRWGACTCGGGGGGATGAGGAGGLGAGGSGGGGSGGSGGSCCAGRTCGPDPCGSGQSCGACPANYTCGDTGQCECTEIILPPECGPFVTNCGRQLDAGPCATGRCEGGTCVHFCGDGTCDSAAGETPGSCPTDCGSGGGCVCADCWDFGPSCDDQCACECGLPLAVCQSN